MAAGKKKLSGNYIVVESWMSDGLKLKGASLIIYAIIYGFSQTEAQLCTCGIDYMRSWTNASKQGVLDVLDRLVAAGLVERIYDATGDGRVTAYRAIGQESLPIFHGELGQESLPKSKKKVKKVDLKKGQESLPIEDEKRSTFFRATYNKNNNNFQTDKSVCQSTRACAREDETDGQGEKEFYAECIFMHWQELKFKRQNEDLRLYENRLSDVVKELMRRDAVTVNGVQLSSAEMLKVINELFADVPPDKLLSALVAGCAPEIKKKFNYTVTALYNAAKQF